MADFSISPQDHDVGENYSSGSLVFKGLIGIVDTDRTDNCACEIIYNSFTCKNYHFSTNREVYEKGYFIILERLSFILYTETYMTAWND